MCYVVLSTPPRFVAYLWLDLRLSEIILPSFDIIADNFHQASRFHELLFRPATPGSFLGFNVSMAAFAPCTAASTVRARENGTQRWGVSRC